MISRSVAVGYAATYIFGVLGPILLCVFDTPLLAGVKLRDEARRAEARLVSGLLFGWARAKHPTFGASPSASAQVLRDIGLSGFIAVVGLQAGREAWLKLLSDGPTLLGLGAIITIVPLLLTYIVMITF